jgi:uncharacterized protein YkwD
VDPSLIEDVRGETEEPGDEPFVPETARADQVAALDRANWYRAMTNLPPLDMLEPINLAAQAHSDYYAKHYKQYGSMSPHNENAAWDGFTGVSPWDRMGHFGYAAGASEVMAFLHNATGAVDGWMNTLYHRLPFMDATMTACGYGAAGGGGYTGNAVDTMDFGTRDAEGKAYIGPTLEGVYPPPDSVDIPRSFDGAESPQPPPPPGGYPSGTIVSITWSSTAQFAAEEHRIWAETDEQELPHVWLDSTNDPNLQGANTVALYAYKPLLKGTTYWVLLKGSLGGKPYEKTWSFKTASF